MSNLTKWANPWFVLLLYVLLCGCGANNEENDKTRSINQKIATNPPFRILILGDSLTEGYGVSPNQAFPALFEQKLNQSSLLANRTFEVINGGVTGSTTSGGLSRISWYFKNPPDYLILALGANDGLRGIAPLETKKNLGSILKLAAEQGIPCMLAGMKLPPNYGIKYLDSFENIFPQLAEENNIPLLPFLLEGVGGNPTMNLPDRIHPNPSGHRKICKTVFHHFTEHFSTLSL